MSGVSKLIDESVYERAKEALKLSSISGDVSYKVQAIKSAKEHGISKVADIFDITRKTLMSWISKFSYYGLEGLKIQKGRGRKAKLSDSELEALKTIVEANPTITIKVLRIKIVDLFDKDLSVGALHNLLTKLKFSYITPRPRHHKQDKSLSSDFKKNLRDKASQNPQKHLFFFDESRFGTHSKIGHGWFKKGSRTQVKIKLGFENFYLYSAVNPQTGQDFTLVLPKVNTAHMNLFLKEMDKQLEEAQAIIVMDGAGWHKSAHLEIPANIEILYLPPYTPELNPVERLWLYIKQNIIKNKLFDTLADLEDAVCQFLLEKLNAEILKSICSAKYLVS